jgi:hypothetical protein
MIETFYMGISVAHSNFRLPGISAYDIVAKIFSLRVYVTDQGTPVPDAIIRVYISEASYEAVTDSSGVALFKQIPSTAISVVVFKDGKRLGDGVITLDRNDALMIERMYYYTVRFNVIDKEKLAIRNVRVHIGAFFNLTDESGASIVEVKKGTYKLEMTMYGLPVHSSTLTVTKDASVNITISASTLLATLTDETGQPYIGPVTVHFGNVNLTTTTDALGSMTIKQAPYGEVGVSTPVGIVTKFQYSGEHEDVSVTTRELRIIATPQFAYQLGSMRIRVVASIGELPLKKVKVSVTSKTGAVAALTNSGGIVEIDVPLYLDNPAIAVVKVSAYGQEKTKTVVADSSPLMLFIIPLGLVPLILFAVLTEIHRRTLPSPT